MTQLNDDFYTLTQSLWGAYYNGMGVVRTKLGEPPEPPPPLLQVQAGRAESAGWFLVQAAEFDPEPLTVSNLRARDVYASERVAAALLEMMAAARWLDRRGDAYYLTVDGRSLMEKRRQDVLRWLAPLDEKTAGVSLSRLSYLLQRVITVCLATADPPGNWCLAHSRRRAPAPEASLSAHIYQYVADINAFRDDAHMAAWRPYGISGYAWEAFSFLEAGLADTAVTLFEQLSYRGYSRSDYAGALRDLAARGWLVEGADGRYLITDMGRDIRAEAENRTDLYFYTPWRETLTPNEIEEVESLIIQLRDALQQVK